MAKGDRALVMEASNDVICAFQRRIVLVSPPRTGSTLVARILWEHRRVQYHCHEPFEARYWGGHDESVRQNLRNPLRVPAGGRVPLEEVGPNSGVLLKEMSFQLDAQQFATLSGMATAPVVFVMRDPVLSTASRLRIVHELYGADTFPPFESGWQSLTAHVAACRDRDVPYVIVDSDDLRTSPGATASALLAALGLGSQPVVHWRPRPELHLCTPEVGSLMSTARVHDDPFYRRILRSDGVQPPDRATAEDRASIAAAGLAEHLGRWVKSHERLRADPGFLDNRAGTPAFDGTPAP